MQESIDVGLRGKHKQSSPNARYIPSTAEVSPTRRGEGILLFEKSENSTSPDPKIFDAQLVGEAYNEPPQIQKTHDKIDANFWECDEPKLPTSVKCVTTFPSSKSDHIKTRKFSSMVTSETV